MTCPACNRQINDLGDADHTVDQKTGALLTCLYTTRTRPESLDAKVARLETKVAALEAKP